MEVSCIWKGQSVLYLEDIGWISILTFSDICGQLNGLRRKLKTKILLAYKLHRPCSIHIFWTTLFVLQMPRKCSKNTNEGRLVGILNTLNISSNHLQTGLWASVQNELCLEYLLTFKRDFWRHLTCIYGPKWSSYTVVMTWRQFA